MEESIALDTPQFTIGVPSLDGGANLSIAVHEKNSDQFAARLRKMFKLRRKWAKKAGVNCYRVYDADLPDYAAAIDIYECTDALDDSTRDFAEPGERFLYIAEYQAPSSIDPQRAARRLVDILAIAPAVCDVLPEDVFCKQRKREKGGAQYSENYDSFTFCTREAGMRLEIDLGAYLDTGLFLDHRDTRFMVREMCAGKRFLNLFAYTGSCTVQAAAGGAASTTTVDLSQTYLDWARRNMALNGFTGSQHVFERSDTLSWLRNAQQKKLVFDVAFVDPPTFSNSKAMKGTWDVQRDHVELLHLVSDVLAPDGTIVFSCNLRNFKINEEALSGLDLIVEDISARTIPVDFERNAKIHKCYLIRKA